MSAPKASAVVPQPNGITSGALSSASSSPETLPVQARENVYLFVPNLIGYSRVILALGSLFFMDTHPKYCTVLYCVSCLLDAFDGMAARALGQSTQFGAVLDMITDRCTTSCLLCFLAAAWPNWKILFQLLIALDFGSHYIHMYAAISGGSVSHKKVSKETSKWLWYYYHNTNVLFAVCAANELFFVALYLMKSYTTPLGVQPAYFVAPLFGFDLSLASAWTAHAAKGSFGPNVQSIVSIIARLTWPQLLGAVTMPICAFKQVINVIQITKASSALVEADLVARYEAKLAAESKSQ